MMEEEAEEKGKREGRDLEYSEGTRTVGASHFWYRNWT